jgi:alpha-glucoside transport system substrate-binding protein
MEEKMKRWLKLLVIVMVLGVVLAACAPAPVEAPAEEAAPAEEVVEEEAAEPEVSAMCMGAKPGDKLSVMYQWTGGEAEKIAAVFQPLVDECGLEINAVATRDAAVLDTRVKSTPPDILFWPTTSPLKLYPDALKTLDSVGGVAANYEDFWITGGSVDGKWFALPVKTDPKTMIWYSPAQFEIYGYSVPTTLEELDKLVDQMVADGLVPWSAGMESEAATGWTGSDFVQDLLLASEGPEYVNKLISGEIAYDDAGVVWAYEKWAGWA